MQGQQRGYKSIACDLQLYIIVAERNGNRCGWYNMQGMTCVVFDLSHTKRKVGTNQFQRHARNSTDVAPFGRSRIGVTSMKSQSKCRRNSKAQGFEVVAINLQSTEHPFGPETEYTRELSLLHSIASIRYAVIYSMNLGIPGASLK